MGAGPQLSNLMDGYVNKIPVLPDGVVTGD
jgi:hypothetical protein